MFIIIKVNIFNFLFSGTFFPSSARLNKATVTTTNTQQNNHNKNNDSLILIYNNLLFNF